MQIREERKEGPEANRQRWNTAMVRYRQTDRQTDRQMHPTEKYTEKDMYVVAFVVGFTCDACNKKPFKNESPD